MRQFYQLAGGSIVYKGITDNLQIAVAKGSTTSVPIERITPDLSGPPYQSPNFSQTFNVRAQNFPPLVVREIQREIIWFREKSLLMSQCCLSKISRPSNLRNIDNNNAN